MPYLEPHTTQAGTHILADPANDACYVSREVLDDLERRAFGHDRHTAVLVRGLEETAAAWKRVAIKYQRDREDGRAVAAIFSLGALGLGVALALALNPPG